MNPTVFFICTGNVCRSPLAEAFFNRMAEQTGLLLRAASAGLSPAAPSPSNGTLQVAAEYGLDLSGHRPRALSAEMVSQARHLLTMTWDDSEEVVRRFPPSAGKVATMLGLGCGDEEIREPQTGDLEEYRWCARTIEEAVVRVVEFLRLPPPS